MNGQIAFTYHPIQSIFSISSNTEKLIFCEYKIETNTFASNMNMELSTKINVKKTDWVNYYVGPGISFNPAYSFVNLSIFNGYLLDVGARIKPIQKYKNIQLVFELSPYINREFNGGNLRTRLGVAYNFASKKGESEKKE